MIGRILWLAALLGVAAVTAALQLDRQSEDAPQIAPLVPAPLRGYAQAQIAAAALEQDDPAVALDAAKELVRRRPMPAEHLTLLAAAQAKAGDVDAAVFTIQLAAQRGWRERVAQETVLRLAVAAGDKPEAARRYAALFRSNATTDELLIEFAPQVLGEAGGAGQVTFAAILAGAPRWYELFLQRGARVMPPATFAQVLGLSLDRGAPFACEPLQRAAEDLGKRDAAAAANLIAPIARRCA